MMSKEAEKIVVSTLFPPYHFLWPFLCFNEPIFDMLKAKGRGANGWGKIYKTRIRAGFKRQLESELRGYTFKKFIWGRDKDKPWFTCEGFTSHIYSQDVLRCLDLVGIDQGFAQSAVDQMFKVESLTPIHNVLCNDPSEMLGLEI